jgi:hypothetical protein
LNRLTETSEEGMVAAGRARPSAAAGEGG